MVQVLYLLEVFILAHYDPPSTETRTTDTTIVWCHKNSWIYLTKYLLLVTFETNDNYSIRFEMKKNTIRTALVQIIAGPCEHVHPPEVYTLYAVFRVSIRHSLSNSRTFPGISTEALMFIKWPQVYRQAYVYTVNNCSTIGIHRVHVNFT